MAANITAVIVALIGFGGIALGIYFSRKGQQRSEDSERVASVFATQQKLIEDLQKERDTALAGRSADRDAYEKEAGRLRLDNLACHNEINKLTNNLVELHKIVSIQIERSAAVTVAYDADEEQAEVERIREFIRTMKEM